LFPQYSPRQAEAYLEKIQPLLPLALRKGHTDFWSKVLTWGQSIIPYTQLRAADVDTLQKLDDFRRRNPKFMPRWEDWVGKTMHDQTLGREVVYFMRVPLPKDGVNNDDGEPHEDDQGRRIKDRRGGGGGGGGDGRRDSFGADFWANAPDGFGSGAAAAAAAPATTVAEQRPPVPVMEWKPECPTMQLTHDFKEPVDGGWAATGWSPVILRDLLQPLDAASSTVVQIEQYDAPGFQQGFSWCSGVVDGAPKQGYVYTALLEKKPVGANVGALFGLQ
jgi:hypothetical protein